LNTSVERKLGSVVSGSRRSRHLGCTSLQVKKACFTNHTCAFGTSWYFRSIRFSAVLSLYSSTRTLLTLWHTWLMGLTSCCVNSSEYHLGGAESDTRMFARKLTVIVSVVHLHESDRREHPPVEREIRDLHVANTCKNVTFVTPNEHLRAPLKVVPLQGTHVNSMDSTNNTTDNAEIVMLEPQSPDGHPGRRINACLTSSPSRRRA
jgi:hypothetical protein